MTLSGTTNHDEYRHSARDQGVLPRPTTSLAIFSDVNCNVSRSSTYIILDFNQRTMRLLKLLAKTSRSVLPAPLGFKSTHTRLAVSRAASLATAPAQDSNANTQTQESYRAHIDFKFVRDNIDLVRENAKNRLVNASPDEVVRLYDEFVSLTQESDAVRAARNENSSQMKRKLEADEREKLVEHGKALKAELDTIDEKLRAVEARLQAEGKKLPNLTHPDVPVGGEDEATLIVEVGSKAAFGFEAKDHVTLGEALGVLDFDTGSVVSGSKFYYLRKEAALLEMALVRRVHHDSVSSVSPTTDVRSHLPHSSRVLVSSCRSTMPCTKSALGDSIPSLRLISCVAACSKSAGFSLGARARRCTVWRTRICA
jgi:hypothetical protein